MHYQEWQYEHDAAGKLIRNYYGNPIVSPDQFTGEHTPIVPASAGNPPFCTCGWTRHDGIEHHHHLADMKGA